MAFDPTPIIAEELALPLERVAAALALAADGATVPFIARYRKEATGGLDEVQVQAVLDRGSYLRELEEQRQTILTSIAEQGKLDEALAARIRAARGKTELEDLYLPYRPKRKTRAAAARERGLGPLADLILDGGRGLAPRADLAAPFLAEEVADIEAAFAGARDIVAEIIAERASVRAALRAHALTTGELTARAVAGKQEAGAKFKDYFDFRERAQTIPSHRLLALRRGEKEGFLRVALEVDELARLDLARREVARDHGDSAGAPLAGDLEAALADSCRRLLGPAIEVDVRVALKERAEREAIRVFADNLRHLLLAPPLGGKRVLAIDPGLRTGCKLAVIDAQGELLAHEVVHFTQSDARAKEAAERVVALCASHRVEAIAVGNGTGGREAEAALRGLDTAGRLGGAKVVVVSEAGASVYSASEVAREELPDQDITVRGAVSIGRRLQDPLAELVKIDPKAIGVGQYQHDVHQPTLAQALDAVVESCVNRVGVDVNTASARLLRYVAGVGESLAKAIVSHRAEHGPFHRRAELKRVQRLGPKAFEQAAGFLRVRGGADPLDDSAVHPESYDIVGRMAGDLGVEVAGLVGRRELLDRIDPARYVDDRRGEPTLRDILGELAKPGRDPRAQFAAVEFRADVTAFEHLAEGMVLAGVVTNVTQFGAFVDVGVHQDGLVHVSELAHRFVRDPAEVVRVGDRVKVKVVKLDAARRRIGLSMKQAAERPVAAPPATRSPGPASKPTGRERPAPPEPKPFNGIRLKNR